MTKISMIPIVYITAWAMSAVLLTGNAYAKILQNINVNLSVSKGQKIQITTMYSVDRKRCKGDKTPPKPIFFGKLKFGVVKYPLGTTNPFQCPDIVINANFADYIASDIPGVDKFKIHWKSENGSIFIRNYKIKVE